jgi:hypothetical protein
MECETGTLIADYIINTQSDIIILSKIQTDIHGQEEQLNKGVYTKVMVQQTLLQSYTYIRKRSLSLGELITERGLAMQGSEVS